MDEKWKPSAIARLASSESGDGGASEQYDHEFENACDHHLFRESFPEHEL